MPTPRSFAHPLHFLGVVAGSQTHSWAGCFPRCHSFLRPHFRMDLILAAWQSGTGLRQGAAETGAPKGRAQEAWPRGVALALPMLLADLSRQDSARCRREARRKSPRSFQDPQQAGKSGSRNSGMCHQVGWLHIPDLWLITSGCKGSPIPPPRASIGMPNPSPPDLLRGSVVMTVVNHQHHLDTSVFSHCCYLTTPEFEGRKQSFIIPQDSTGVWDASYLVCGHLWLGGGSWPWVGYPGSLTPQ